jgi:CMP-N-acetylneuraminic acid synthetase
MYIRNGAIYLTRRDILLGESYKGIRCAAYVMPAERSVNIDTLRDFEYAEWTAQRKKP